MTGKRKSSSKIYYIHINMGQIATDPPQILTNVHIMLGAFIETF